MGWQYLLVRSRDSQAGRLRAICGVAVKSCCRSACSKPHGSSAWGMERCCWPAREVDVDRTCDLACRDRSLRDFHEVSRMTPTEIVRCIRGRLMVSCQAGADFVLSTLRGYTEDTNHALDFDPNFIEELVRASAVPVIAEGRISSPEQARQAIAAGALAVVVGTAITRPTEIARRFAAAIESEHARRHAVRHAIGIDLGGTQTKYGIVGSDGSLLFK